MWWKALPGTKIAERGESWEQDPETMRRIVFFSKMSPPEVLAEFILMQTQRVRVQLYGSCFDTEMENMDLGRSPAAHEAATSPAHTDTHTHAVGMWISCNAMIHLIHMRVYNLMCMCTSYHVYGYMS